MVVDSCKYAGFEETKKSSKLLHNKYCSEEVCIHATYKGGGDVGNMVCEELFPFVMGL